MELDCSLYPDLAEEELPSELNSVEEQADYIHRFCSAWDFYGFPPTRETLEGMSGWREAFERFPILQSPAYCALCELLGIEHGPPEAYLGRLRWEEEDELEGRDYDSCLAMF